MPRHEAIIPSGALTIPESANYLRISEASVWRLIKSGALPRAVLSIKRTVIRRIDLDAFLERSCVQAA